jgi:hypothetical protein
MSYPSYLRERARELRTEKHFSIDEIAARLALPRTTVYYWVIDIPLGRPRSSAGQRKGNLAMQEKWRRLRDEAYQAGAAEYEELVLVPTFREFVTLYIAEGYKRCRNVVSLANSDVTIVAMAIGRLRFLSEKTPFCSIQYHADQDLDELRVFWGAALAVEPSTIRLLRKSNSNQLAGRSWRSEHGVLTVGVNDTLLRARLQAWIDRIRCDWTLNSAPSSGA